ncbi:hypothetical protein KUCAC02_004951 [Chaenocephalus aceratus]|uniref:Uncharacterized protein n=1 Tax=Chaenocephalus aceratus TaxID=36190 RepID=A0ACB9X237_CHAAC|nr:hypothetical protein KUCAC02_004951 [Chaenocephalus aceratus]
MLHLISTPQPSWRQWTSTTPSPIPRQCPFRQLSYCRRDIRDSAGVWGEGRGMLLVLQDHMLTLVDPDDHSLLHSQPIISIRVWGVGRDHDR